MNPCVVISWCHIPDDNFFTSLQSQEPTFTYDVPNNLVNTADVAAMTTLTMIATTTPDALGIADMTGIECFTGFGALDIGNNQVSSLNLQFNTALTILNCPYNQISSINLTQNTALTDVWCAVNLLTIYH